MKYIKSGATIEIEIEVTKVGNCLAAILSGGEAPHIGCTVLAEPRPSLADPEAISCTSSVINRVGHKDEYVCRPVAEALCVKYNTAVVCTGGIHVDGISQEQIAEVNDLLEALLTEIKAD